MKPLPHTIVPYDREVHGAFVSNSFRMGYGRIHGLAATYLTDMLRRGGRCAVAHVAGRPDLLLGFAATAAGGDVLWVYVRRRLRRRGLGTLLLLHMGADVSQPTPCRLWNRVAGEIAARGYRIFPRGE